MKTKRILPLVISALFCMGVVSTRAFKASAESDSEGKSSLAPIANAASVAQKKISLSFPGENQEIDILKPRVANYISTIRTQAAAIENDYVLHDFYARADSDGANYGKEYTNATDLVKVNSYAQGNGDSRSKNVAFVFDPQGLPANTVFTVKYGEKNDLSDAKSVQTTENYVEIINLKSGTNYYWQVSGGGVSSPIQKFKTKNGFRMITAYGVQNIRDMGGRTVYGGKRIKQGLIYRGGELVREDYKPEGSSTHHKTLTPENLKILREDLGIRYEIDFRGDEESNNITESQLVGEGYTSEDIKYMRISNIAAYDYFFEKSKSNTEFWGQVKNMFLAFKNANERPVYFHCWGGADRTGTIGFILGALLGSSMTDLVTDFELTSFAGNYRPHNINDENKVYRFPSFMYELFEGTNVNPFRTDGKLIKDIVADFLKEYAGLTDTDISEIRQALLED